MKKKAIKKVTEVSLPLPPDHPDVLLQKAETMPFKTRARLDLNVYIKTICLLHDRGYSYSEITDWLNQHLADRLGQTRINRGQVYRAYQQWVIFDQQSTLEMMERGGLRQARGITDEQAEKEAAEADAGSSSSPT